MRSLSWCSEGGGHVGQRAAVAALPKLARAGPPAYVNRTTSGYKSGPSSAHPKRLPPAQITPTGWAVQSGPPTGGVTGPQKAQSQAESQALVRPMATICSPQERTRARTTDAAYNETEGAVPV